MISAIAEESPARIVPASASQLDATLLAAYRSAHYQVHEPHPYVLQVDAYSAALHASHQRFRVRCSAFLSACNPRGRLLDEAANARRHAALLKALRNRGLDVQPGFGADPERCWPGEASALVHGLGLEAACDLAARHEQNALLWATADAIPRLILLR